MTDAEKATYYKTKAERLREMAKQISFKQHRSELLKSAVDCDQSAMAVEKPRGSHSH